MLRRLLDYFFSGADFLSFFCFFSLSLRGDYRVYGFGVWFSLEFTSYYNSLMLMDFDSLSSSSRNVCCVFAGALTRIFRSIFPIFVTPVMNESFFLIWIFRLAYSIFSPSYYELPFYFLFRMSKFLIRERMAPCMRDLTLS